MEKLHSALRWLDRWGKSVITVVAAALAFGGAFWGSLVDDSDPVLRWVLFGVGLVGAVTAALVPIVESRQLRSRIKGLETDVARVRRQGQQAEADAKLEGRKEFLVALEAGILPLLEKLGTLVRARRAPTKAVLASDLKGLAFSALKEVIDPSIPRLRANYFKLRFSDPGDAMYLQEAGSTATAPRQRFDLTSGTAESDAILEMLAQNKFVFTDDCVENPPAGFDATRERSYRTFISATASDGVEVDGMLTVDSPVAGSLTGADATLVQLVATIIAISEAVKDGKKDDAED